jgi:hypothetical protein
MFSPPQAAQQTIHPAQDLANSSLPRQRTNRPLPTETPASTSSPPKTNPTVLVLSDNALHPSIVSSTLRPTTPLPLPAIAMKATGPSASVSKAPATVDSAMTTRIITAEAMKVGIPL